MIATWLPSSVYSEDADSLFNQGRWREALQTYQTQICKQALEQKITSSKPEAFFSTLVESDSDTLLKAHCLFERGVLAFLKRDSEAAAMEWGACRDTLNTIPPVGNLYLRRVNMALAQLWIVSSRSKDLKFFHEGLIQIFQTIDDAPLPEDTADFRCQLQQEYWFTSAKAVLSAIQTLNTNDENEALGLGVISQKLTELWSKKALFSLLANEMTDTSKSHEALVDKVVFADASHDTSAGLYKKLLEAWKALPPPAYSDTAALMCVYTAETGADGLLQSLLKDEMDSRKLDRNRFGNGIYRALQVAVNFRAVNREKLLQGISKRLDLMAWPNPATRIEVAVWIAKAGNGVEALQLLQTLKEMTPESPIYPHLCAALTEVFYLAGDFKKSLSVGSTLSEAGGNNLPAEFFYWRALSFAKLQKTGDAIDSLKAFLTKAPEATEAPEACFFLATLCLSSGKKSEAQRYFQQTAISYAGTSYAERAKEFSRTLTK